MSDLESSLARPFGERGHPAVIEPAPAVEDDAFDAGALGPTREQLARGLGPSGLVVAGNLAIAHLSDRAGADVVDQLGVDELVRTVHGQSRPGAVARDLLADPGVAALARR